MTKMQRNENKREIEKAFFTKKAAELAGVSVREARYALAMDRKNDRVITAYMTLGEKVDQAVREVSAILLEIDPAPAPKAGFCPRNGQ